MKKLIKLRFVLLSVLSLALVFVWTSSALAAGENPYFSPYTGSEPDTLVLWKFDGATDAAREAESGSGSNYAITSWGYQGQAGSGTTPDSTSETGGKFGGAYVSTTEGYGSAANGFSVWSGTDIVKTIEFWFLVDSSVLNPDGTWNEGNLGVATWEMEMLHGGFGIYLENITDRMVDQAGYDSGGNFFGPAMTWAPDTWYHYAAEYRDSTHANPGATMYLDGVVIATDDRSIIWGEDASADLRFGNYASTYDLGLVGKIDEVRVSNTAFNPVYCTQIGTITELDDPMEVEEATSSSVEFSVELDSSPSGTDTITIDIDPNSNGNGVDLTVLPTQLTFTSADWDTPQTVTVTAINDTWSDGFTEVDSIGFTVTSSDPCDPCYADACISSLGVTIIDDDSASIFVSKTTASVIEGGSGDSYTVELATPPTSPVTIYVAAGMEDASPTDSNQVPDAFDCQITVNGGGSDALVFNSGNYDTPQAVAIAAVDDSLFEADPHEITITNNVDTDDAEYGAFSADDVVVSITDNDVRGWSFGDDVALTVVNYSFEDPVLGDGGVADFNTVDPVPGHGYWEMGQMQIINPTAGEWAAMYKTATQSPDGTQQILDMTSYAGTELAYGVCEYLIEPGPVSYTYEVSVGVPEPNDSSAYLTFYVSSNDPAPFGRIADPTFSLSAGDLVAGEWVDIKVCGVVEADSSFIGGVLSIGIVGQGVQMDNWRLTLGNHPCDGCHGDITEAEGDLDDDCDVDLADFSIFAGHFLDCLLYPECVTGW